MWFVQAEGGTRGASIKRSEAGGVDARGDDADFVGGGVVELDEHLLFVGCPYDEAVGGLGEDLFLDGALGVFDVAGEVALLEAREGVEGDGVGDAHTAGDGGSGDAGPPVV